MTDDINLNLVSSFPATPEIPKKKLQIADRTLNDCGNEKAVKKAKPETLTITERLTLLPDITVHRQG